MPTLFTLLALLFSLFLANVLLPLARNIRAAKRTGLPFVVVPYYGYNRLTSIILGRIILRPARRFFPDPSPISWRRLVSPAWPFAQGHAPFRLLGSDTFLTVSPGGIIVHTADAEVISNVASRGADFPKAIHLYRSLDVFGKNVVSSEGHDWRRHRKVVGPAFGERVNQVVWTETARQTQAMLASWLGEDGGGDGEGGRGKTIRSVAPDTMRLSLHVISRAGLGREMSWPKNGMNTDAEVPEGHKVGFTEALQELLRQVLVVMLLPMWILRNAPTETVRKAYGAYEEWGRYMKEILAEKKEAVELEARSGESREVDLIGQLVKGYEGEGNEDREDKETTIGAQTGLTDTEVMGNLFTLTIAGHETSASSIHFCLLLLAIHPDIQQEAQNELDTIFVGREPVAWSYPKDLSRLLNSRLGAVLNEELRIIGSVMNVPKVVAGSGQTIRTEGRDVMLGTGWMVGLCVASVHRNPRFWPEEGGDLDKFTPRRWLRSKSDAQGEQEDSGVKSGVKTEDAEVSEGLYVPPKGAFVPFSEGMRACLGKRFAQIEIFVALSVILSQCSIELAVDEWASDEEVEKMAKEEKREVWMKARDKAEWILGNKIICGITLVLRGAAVPVRIVRRGEERFMDL